MTTAAWFLLVGILLVLMGLTADAIKRLPVTSAIIYLAVGILIGPTVLHAFHFNPLKQAGLLEIITEAAVLLSLFTAGIKMPVPITFRRWLVPTLLAFVAMTMTVAVMAVFGYWLLGLPMGAAILLGAILAPTDPVLATDVQIRHPGDRDRLRFRLTCEAGMNDGSAFPFVMLGLGLLGLHELGPMGSDWLLQDVIWATLGAVVAGLACGSTIGHLVFFMRKVKPGIDLWDDFLGLGLIGVTYGLSLWADTWGFLAVFFAAVALRQTEQRLTTSHQQASGTMASEAVARGSSRISDNTLPFKEQLERLSELVLVILVGGSLFLNSWSLRAVTTALVLFFLARPLGVFFSLSGTAVPWRQRIVLGWFGVRGIGSLYYLMYAIEHGIAENLALELVHVTLIVVTLSILLHGISVRRMIAWLIPRTVEFRSPP